MSRYCGVNTIKGENSLGAIVIAFLSAEYKRILLQLSKYIPAQINRWQAVVLGNLLRIFYGTDLLSLLQVLQHRLRYCIKETYIRMRVVFFDLPYNAFHCSVNSG